MAWLTIEQVKKITGVEVTDSDIALAGSTIEDRTGVFEEQVGLLGGRDRRVLVKAISYQAAWLADRPDTHDRDDVDSVSQDGASANLKKWANTLAPFARVALRGLSWKGTRSSTTGGPSTERELDDSYKWEPIR